MPKSPVYRSDQIPQRLNPLNLKHYLLLAYWIFFRPIVLTSYFYQCGASKSETREGGWYVFQSPLSLAAYRDLSLMILGIIVATSLLIGFPLTLISNWIQGNSLTLWECLSINLLGLAFEVTLSIFLNISLGLMVARTLGIAAGGVFGTTLSISLGVALSFASQATNESFGLAFSTTVGLAFGFACVLALSMGSGVGTGVVLGSFASWILGLFLALIGGTEFGLAFAIAGMLGAVRLFFYPLHFVSSITSLFTNLPHPVMWDEMIFLPLPGTVSSLEKNLNSDNFLNIMLLTREIRNPFQRWAVQITLKRYLRTLSSPLSFFYTILKSPDFDVRIFPAVVDSNWGPPPSLRSALLAEFSHQWLDCLTDPIDRFSERLVWWLTRSLREQLDSELTQFAGMLYEILDEDIINSPNFHLSSYAETYTDLMDYPGGDEIARTFELMTTFLTYDNLLDLSYAADEMVLSSNRQLSHPQISGSIRPPVLTALNHLIQIGAEVATYRDATSRVNQLAALARAMDMLDDLGEYVLLQVMIPEYYLLQRIIRQWRRLVSEVGGAVGRIRESGPVANPYIAGNPVIGQIFVGREDILRRLEELWSGEGQKPSVVLYGHRRMGKSSILHNLGARFGPHTVIVDFNMQRVGLVESTAELLYNLALALYDVKILKIPNTTKQLMEPAEERFINHNPYTAFDRFLKRVDQVRDNYRFIVTVDEFELLEKLIADNKLEPRLLDFWRGLIQTYPWFVMAFAGLHTLQEMTHDYWHPLFGSVLGIPVSFLSDKAAWRLITQPTFEFPLDYDQDAVEHILTLTNGQPYLIQLIGHGLVTRFNHQTFEAGIERERRFHVEDVKAVINAPEFYRDGDAYFTGVWRQAAFSDPPGQTAVLKALAPSEAGLTIDEITQQTDLVVKAVGAALKTLKRHDVVKEQNGFWSFTVELMRRWVLEKEGSS